MTPSNYSCPACNAKLLKRQRGEPAKPGEQAFCPHCMAQLTARDGPYTLGYELVEAPPRDHGRNAEKPDSIRVELMAASSTVHELERDLSIAFGRRLAFCGTIS